MIRLFPVFLLAAGLSFVGQAQIDVKGAMGINLISMSGVRDYLNANYAQGQQLGAFNTAVSFDGEAGYHLDKLELAVDAAIEINSFSYDLTANKYKLSYTSVQPSAMAYYVIAGEGYQFKFGGGIGPRFLAVTESGLYSNQDVNYSATGWGILGRVEAGTAISQNAYAFIGGDVGYNHFPIPKNGNSMIISVTNPNGVDFSEFFIGLKLGVIYSINL